MPAVPTARNRPQPTRPNAAQQRPVVMALPVLSRMAPRMNLPRMPPTMMMEEAMPMATGSKPRALAREAIRWLMVAQETRQAAASRASQKATDLVATFAETPVRAAGFTSAAFSTFSPSPHATVFLSLGNLRTKMRVMGITITARPIPMARRTERQP